MEKNLTDLRKQALRELLLQAKKARDKPLYKQLKLRYKKMGADTNREETSQDGSTEQ